MLSERLTYHPVEPALAGAFHALVQDEHVRRFLMDGNVFPRSWTEDRIRDSRALFERRGVGIWLAYDRETAALAGFCGFLEIPALHPAPQLVYALFERFTGRGYATEMARTVIAEARRHPGFEEIIAGVDAVNAASCRVLEKLGFAHLDTQPGHFGDTFLLRLTGAPREGPRPGA